MKHRSYENLFRPAYEAKAAIVWSAAALVMVVMALTSKVPSSAIWYMGGMSLVFSIWRWRQTLDLWSFKISLAGKPFLFMKASVLSMLMRKEPTKAWLGFGFEWNPEHTQRVMEIRKRAVKTIMPPKWFLNLRNIKPMSDIKGAPWIHGVEPREHHIYVPLEALEGHVLVIGTTGSGKTRLLETVVSQAIGRNEAVIVIDPKGDKELRDITRRACEFYGRPDAFVQFHPAFPSDSVRIDPLRNWNRSTEIASRIAALMISEDAFQAFAWRAINLVADGLIYVDRAPNLMTLRKFIEGGPDELMEIVLREFFNRKVPRWETMVAPFVSKARDGKLALKLSPTATPELLAYVYYYRKEVPESQTDQVVDGLLSMVEHSRDHLSKILASLVPLLVMLTAGELGPLLSPDPEDIDDHRPIFDTKKLITGNHVLYLGLDSLSDGTVGSAIGSIILSDLTAVAGEIYNHGVGKPKKVQLIVDEAAEVVNNPLIQILNKARGAGFVTWLLTQTLPDFIARMGSEPKARQILGNCNNLIALRTKDRQTQDFICETFGKTEIQVISRSKGAGSRTEDHGIDFTGSTSESLQDKEVELFPPELLGMLPDLHYIASVAGGRIIKGRLPKIVEG